MQTRNNRLAAQRMRVGESLSCLQGFSRASETDGLDPALFFCMVFYPQLGPAEKYHIMPNKEKELILTQAISNHNFSKQFLELCDKLKFENLAHLLKFRSWELLKLEGFDERMLHEYILFLEKWKLAHLVKD